MKKIITLLTVFVFSHSMIAQDDAKMEDILQRYEVLKNLPISFDYALNQNFTLEEQQLLLDHLEMTIQVPADPISSFVPDMFYAQNVRGDDSFGSLVGPPPYNFNIINANGLNAYADDFGGDGILYTVDFVEDTNTASLYTVDPATGQATLVDVASGLIPGDRVTGLSYNIADESWYALSTEGHVTQVYSVDVATAVFTPIGSGVVGNIAGFWLEIDNDGNAWMADPLTDQLFLVDLTTGTASAVGPLGIDINFIQDASYDHENEELIMAAYFGGGAGGIYSVDTSTGTASLIGETEALNVELGGFSIPPAIGGVEDLIAKKVSAFPNPMQDILHFDLAPGIELNTASLYTVLGSNAGISYDNGAMDVSSLAQGIYILVMETSEGKISQKIVKQ